MEFRDLGRKAAFLAACLAIFGTVSFFDRFAKVRVGPLYLLDFIFLFSISLIHLARTKMPLRSFQTLTVFAAFSIWGGFRAGYDLIQMHWIPEGREGFRFFQHLVVFVYPVLWVGLGFGLFGSKSGKPPKEILWLSWAALAGVLYVDVTSTMVINPSVGPIWVVPAMLMLEKSWTTKYQSVRARALGVGAALACAGLAFFPIWMMWWSSFMQRTTFALLLLGILLVPLLRRSGWLLGLRTVLSALGILSLGFVLISWEHYGAGHRVQVQYMPDRAFSDAPSGVRQAIAQDFFASMQKGEDLPRNQGGELFQARSRKLWWTDAWRMWKTAPIAGVGFLPEVPSQFAEGLANNWDTVRVLSANPDFLISSPISGPHNSYLSVLTRMGVIGLGILLLAIAAWCRRVWTWSRGRTLTVHEVLWILIPVNGFLSAFLHIGFESPQNCVVTWIFAGVALAASQWYT